MAKAKMCVVLKSNIESVWAVVTDNSRYAWRSDLEKIETLDAWNFVEQTRNGVQTKFTILAKQPYARYAFDMKNANIQGHWTGVFRKVSGGTEIEFTEEVVATNPIMNLFAGIYLKRQQKQYIADLRKALGEET